MCVSFSDGGEASARPAIFVCVLLLHEKPGRWEIAGSRGGGCRWSTSRVAVSLVYCGEGDVPDEFSKDLQINEWWRQHRASE